MLAIGGRAEPFHVAKLSDGPQPRNWRRLARRIQMRLKIGRDER